MNVTVPQVLERSSPVILSAAKDLAADRERPFAALRVTGNHCSNGQEPFVQIEPCLRIIIRRDIPMIIGKQIELRPVLVTDLALLRHWEHDLHIDHWMATTANAIDARESYEQEFDRLLRSPRIKLLAVQNKDSAVVGFIRINDIDLVARKATIRMLIAPEMQGQGYGTDALRTLASFCFREL